MNPSFRNFFLILALCLSFKANSALNVVTTTQDLMAIAIAVGGQHITVQSLTPGTRDPHFAEAKPSMIRQVHAADLLLVIGADMEIGWLPPLLQAARNSRILPGNNGYLDLSTAVSLLDKPSGTVTRAMGDVHAMGNPHYWLDPRNGVRIAQTIAARLALLNPAHAVDYQTQAISFTQALEKKLISWREALAALKDKPVIAYHKSFLYLADAFNFRIVGEVEPKPGITPNAASLNQLIATIQREKIDLLIIEPFYERRSARYLREQTKIRVAIVPQSVGAMPTIKNYFDLFDAIISALGQAGEI